MEQKVNALVIHSTDSVAVVIESLKAGDIAVCKIGNQERQVRVRQDIPIYHKIALQDVPQGQQVFKYGKSIGQAVQNIKAGDHVHSHNLVSIRESIVQ